MRLSVTVYPPGNHTMVPTGTRSDILKAPAELHPGPLYKSSQDPISSRKDPVRGGGILRAVPQILSPFPWRNPTGAPPSPCRTIYRLDTWYISRRGPGYF